MVVWGSLLVCYSSPTTVSQKALSWVHYTGLFRKGSQLPLGFTVVCIGRSNRIPKRWIPHRWVRGRSWGCFCSKLQGSPEPMSFVLSRCGWIKPMLMQPRAHNHGNARISILTHFSSQPNIMVRDRAPAVTLNHQIKLLPLHQVTFERGGYTWWVSGNNLNLTFCFLQPSEEL